MKAISIKLHLSSKELCGSKQDWKTDIVRKVGKIKITLSNLLPKGRTTYSNIMYYVLEYLISLYSHTPTYIQSVTQTNGLPVGQS